MLCLHGLDWLVVTHVQVGDGGANRGSFTAQLAIELNQLHAQKITLRSRIWNCFLWQRKSLQGRPVTIHHTICTFTHFCDWAILFILSEGDSILITINLLFVQDLLVHHITLLKIKLWLITNIFDWLISVTHVFIECILHFWVLHNHIKAPSSLMNQNSIIFWITSFIRSTYFNTISRMWIS